MQRKQASVAVIGAGPCGLAVARELLKEGHNVTIFDAGDGVGGAWRFDESATDSDLLGLDSKRVRVHSSMYPGLRTNLPRHIMSLCDFPFSTEALGQRSHDPRTYPLHSEVLAFCEALADAAGLRQHLVLNTRVLRIDPSSQHSAADGGQQAHFTCCSATQTADSNRSVFKQPGFKWRVLTETSNCSLQTAGAAAAAAAAAASAVAGGVAEQQQQQQGDECQQQEWVFDAVASCVGIFSEIHLPQIPGMAQWPGLQLHSHNFRGPAQFKGQKVMVVGASFSGEEIARHIANKASQVLHCARTFSGPGTAREHTTAHAASTAVQADQSPQQQNARHSKGCMSDRTGAEATQVQQQQQACTAHHVDSQLQQQRQHWQQGDIPPAPEPRPNITRLPMLHELRPDGSAVLLGGQVVKGVDAIVYCTGYKCSFPWLEHLGLLKTDNTCVRPLFMHMFIPSVGPSLALCGLPWRCTKFPQFQLQGQLLARLLSGRATMPPQQDMEQDQQKLFAAMQAQGIPLRYTHCMASFMPQDEWKYDQQLVQLAAGSGDAAQQGDQQQQQQQQQQQPSLVSMPNWLADLSVAVAANILQRPDTFRDAWSHEVQDLMTAADTAMHLQLQSQAPTSS